MKMHTRSLTPNSPFYYVAMQPVCKYETLLPGWSSRYATSATLRTARASWVVLLLLAMTGACKGSIHEAVGKRKRWRSSYSAVIHQQYQGVH